MTMIEPSQIPEDQRISELTDTQLVEHVRKLAGDYNANGDYSNSLVLEKVAMRLERINDLFSTETETRMEVTRQ